MNYECLPRSVCCLQKQINQFRATATEFSGKETQPPFRKNNAMSEDIYLVMNKPCGYVCSAVSDSHKTVYDLLTPELRTLVQGAKRGNRLHTIGRLDADTSGLLLFTTDGLFSHNIAANSAISKTYRAVLSKPVSPDYQTEYTARAAKGLTLPPEKKFGEQQCEPAQLHCLSSEVCEITIHEGKFHEVKRIFRALGNEVKELERIAIGSLILPDDLEPGQWRELSQVEKDALYSHQQDC